jgi:hypothetical protein
LWTYWLIGMAIPLAIKLMFYMHKTDPFRYSFSIKLLQFFGKDGATLVKSVLSVLAELAIGSVYVNGYDVPLFGYLGQLPKDPFLAIFFGMLSETLAPLLIALATNKFRSEKENHS